MEFFLPSILFLLVACGIVFFVIPRFGPLVLAGISLILLVLGIYNHYSLFQTEYRLSTWQSGMIAYAPFVMIGALVLAIILYLLYLVPAGGSNGNNSNINSLSENALKLPPPGTATNGLTEGIGNLMRKAANAANINVRNQATNARSPGGVSQN
jgi:branched-subunit amino acid transport protein